MRAQGAEPAFAVHRVAETADVAVANEAIERVYLPNRIDLLDPATPLDMRLNAVRLAGVTVGYVRFGSDVRVVTGDCASYHVNVPLSGAVESRSGNRGPVRGSPRRAAVFTPGAPADLRWRADCAQLCLMIPAETLRERLAKHLDRPVTGAPDFAVAMDLGSGAARELLDLLRLLDRETAKPDGVLRQPLAAATLRDQVIDAVLRAQPHTYSAELTEKAHEAAPRVVRHAIELLRETPEFPWSPAELAAAVAVSVRSLHDGFRRAIGRPPMAYLREVRLGRAHADLLAAEPGAVTVTEVAGRWGFAHLGRFSVGYRDRYGERPNETLRRLP
ncbi:AraC family transcriptional regulator [Amycolatopsis sp. CA-230715]|uniref:AraC family transcriptional regulator n=1 Tax=Amycolatopsis sp. CA-230715 TaxID=2745196 RepID=UPI001C01727C|nr:AraC family transcriptional regulator [Amycolatopsis sp. CA-230715]QWF78399.1 hypothetical protein HUW46_01795 [Amycolatopsis sp. CA-230715]